MNIGYEDEDLAGKQNVITMDDLLLADSKSNA